MLKTELVRKVSDEQHLIITIESNKELEHKIVKEIESLDLPIYWSDGQSKHFSFDTKLSNGLWLENINYNNQLTKATALILN